MPSGAPRCPAPPGRSRSYVGKYETMITAYVIYCGRRTFERDAISRDEVERAAVVAVEAPPERKMRGGGTGGDKEPSAVPRMLSGQLDIFVDKLYQHS